MDTGTRPDVLELGTGTAADEWFRAHYGEIDSATGEAVQDIMDTGRIAEEVELFCQELRDCTGENIEEDPSSAPTVKDMARNLSDLSMVANLMIPGLREMTPPEWANLRNYYKRRFRKI